MNESQDNQTMSIGELDAQDAAATARKVAHRTYKVNTQQNLEVVELRLEVLDCHRRRRGRLELGWRAGTRRAIGRCRSEVGGAGGHVRKCCLQS